LGKTFRVTRQRGVSVESRLAAHVITTVHPSSILRTRDDESRQAEYEAFVQNLRQVAHLAQENTSDKQG
jgi:hypothetical protein